MFLKDVSYAHHDQNY